MYERIRAVELMGKNLGIFEKTDFQMHQPLPWADWFNENWIKLALNHKMSVLWINFLINELNTFFVILHYQVSKVGECFLKRIQGHYLLEPLGDCNLSKYQINQVASIFRWAKGIRYNPRKIDYEHSFGAMPLETRDL